MKKNILVFPCGSEVALEIHRSLKFSIHFNLIGASSVKDHGEFVYENYVEDLPFYTEDNFIQELSAIIKIKKINAVYPAMDAVAKFLKGNEDKLGCKVIGSSKEATSIAASKIKTYELLSKTVNCPKWTNNVLEVTDYPVFIKPDVGYGSRNVSLANNRTEAENHLKLNPNNYVFCEHLPGKEYTIDCFTDKNNQLLFAGARERARISNGISVGTHLAKEHQAYFQETAEKINQKLMPRGAWFFQMKENSKGIPTLLEVATRLGGSSSYFRVQGINFAMLSAFDAFNYEVSVHPNNYEVKLDRALNNKFKLKIEYKTIYVDFDDCIYINEKINTQLIAFLYQELNNKKIIILITRHAGAIEKKLEELRINTIFDEIIHIKDKSPKSKYIDKKQNPIFIDDSHAERREVQKSLNIPVFSPDMIEALLD